MPDAQDEFYGQGGSYVVGADGKRVLVERTKSGDADDAPVIVTPPVAAPAPQPAPETPSNPQPNSVQGE